MVMQPFDCHMQRNAVYLGNTGIGAPVPTDFDVGRVIVAVKMHMRA